MNIYEKIQQVRVELGSRKIVMSGKNEFAKYDYFELDDFLTPLNELMHKHKMTAYASFTQDTATLTAVNCEKPDECVVVTSPMGTANLKGCHEVQNIGAVETYQRRYLYQTLFDIAEHDGLNGTQGKPEQQEKRKDKPDGGKEHVCVSDIWKLPGAEKASNATLFVKALEIAGLTNEEGGKIVKELFGESVKVNGLNPVDFKRLIATVEKLCESGRAET